MIFTEEQIIEKEREIARERVKAWRKANPEKARAIQKRSRRKAAIKALEKETEKDDRTE